MARLLAFASLIACVLAASACDLTVTKERPSFDQLDAHEKSVVQIVLAELRPLDAQIQRRSEHSITRIIDREKIDVSFDGHLFVGNLGDGVVHVSAWDNLTDDQRELVRGWFGSASLAAAEKTYATMFYRVLVVAQGIKQFMYEALTPEWLYDRRSLFNIERDSIRATMSYYRDSGKRSMWSFTAAACKPMISKYAGRWPFSKTYLRDHFQSLAEPSDPTGYMYYFCKWLEMGRADAVSFSGELRWLENLPAWEKKQDAKD